MTATLCTASPSISPDHSDARLLDLGERFDQSTIKMNAAQKRLNSLIRKAYRLAGKMSGVDFPPPSFEQATIFLDKLGEAEKRVGGIQEGSDQLERLTDDVERLANEIASHPATTIEGARVHVRVFKEMYLGTYGGNPADDPNAEYNLKRVRALTDALLA